MCLTGETTSHLTDNLSQQSMNCKIYHIGEVCIVILTTLVSLHTEIDQISEKVSFADLNFKNPRERRQQTSSSSVCSFATDEIDGK